MDRNVTLENIDGYWNPARRPNDDQQQQPSSTEPLSPADAHARSEGLPPIDCESKPNDDLQGKQRPVQYAEEQPLPLPANKNEAPFLDHPTLMAFEEATNSSSAGLGRKATPEVFESLQFSSDEVADASGPTVDSVNGLNSTLEHKDSQKIETPPDGNSKDGTDVSALWEAVLDDDDFLADDSDGFLPDSRPQSSPGSPSSFLGSFNDGTNFQEPDEVLSSFGSRSLVGDGSFSASSDHRHQTASSQSSNPYAPHQPSTSDLSQMSSTTYGKVGLGRPNFAPLSFGQDSRQGQLQRPAAPTKAESFVAQSKGGYKSPYDLPMDLSKPRKRVQMYQPPPASKVPVPPPRSRSMTSDQRPGSSTVPLRSPFTPAHAIFEGQVQPSSSHYSAPPPSVFKGDSTAPPSNLKAKASSPSFFEELPVATKPRPPSSHGSYTPTQPATLPPQIPTASLTAAQLQNSTPMQPPAVPTKPSSIDSYSQYQLQRPERLDPYTNVPFQPPIAPVGSKARYSPASPVSKTAPPAPRYSPAPPTSLVAPPPPAPFRYSPAPPPNPNAMQTQNRYVSQPQPSPQLPSQNAMPQNRYVSQPANPVANVLPFQPRTSSPLAYHGKKSDQHVDESDERNDRAHIQPPTHYPGNNPPQETSSPSSDTVFGQDFAPPRRSQTHSPGKKGPGPSLIPTSSDIVQRPASVHSPSSPITSANTYQSFPPARPSVRQRGLSQNLNLIPPTDDSQHDQLQRWRGSPIFRFGFGGSVLSSFPRHVPRYTAGSPMPLIKPMAGEVRLQNAKDIFPLSEHVASFPGPLRSKSKKKEVLAWLSNRIKTLESMSSASPAQLLPDHVKMHDERVLLWKTVQVIVEHDGAVDGNVEVQRAMNLVLSPASANPQDFQAIHNTVSPDVHAIYRPVGTITKAEAGDPAAVESIRKCLLCGEREKAVWTAVDHRLWGHAMLLSYTLGKSIWKQVAHEFVRQEVKATGANTEALAALYEIFAGNLEESVDELVPPSARAGLQMISKVGSAESSKRASDGLDRWKETFSLVLNNRSVDDQKALAALGRLLASYGRIEASHICHLFSGSPTLPSIFGGADDSQASIVLLGADHRNQPHEFFLDTDAVLLTEVYEYATTILASNLKAPLMPHLQAYKLQRVRSLAEAGFRLEAQTYCETMGASLRSTTKPSPYYHPQFLAELDELSQRLSQSPAETSSWISKPTMGKVSDSMWNKFTTFVAGDDSDAASTSSGKDAGHEFGPFAKVSGTPTMSQPGSSSDLHGLYISTAPQSTPNAIAGSRYASSGQYSARSSSDLPRGRPSLDSQRLALHFPQGSIQRSPYDSNATPSQPSHMSQSIPTQSASPYAPLGASPPVRPHQTTPPQTSYAPTAPPNGHISPYKPRTVEPYVPLAPPEQLVTSVANFTAPAPAPAPAPQLDSHTTEATPFNSYSPTEARSRRAPSQEASSYTPAVQSYSSYEPPSTEYVPYQSNPSSDSESEKRKAKKKSFMDDDDDFPSSTFDQTTRNTADGDGAGAAATAAAARKKANDEAAEAAFRAAAETDAIRDKPSTAQDNKLKAKSSWFGSFFGRKESDLLDSSSNKGNGSSGSGEGQKVIRAKLGEESSFYYDKELKKWVNKKNPASMQQSAKATPPPPKGPIGRVVSESLGTALVGGGVTTSPPPSSLKPAGRPQSSDGPLAGAATPGENSDGFVPPASVAAFAVRDGRQSAPPSSTSNSSTVVGAGGPASPMVPPPTRPASTALSTATDIDDLLGGLPSVGARKPVGTLKGKKGRGGGRYVDVMAK